jgi:hypothetical protein
VFSLRSNNHSASKDTFPCHLQTVVLAFEGIIVITCIQGKNNKGNTTLMIFLKLYVGLLDYFKIIIMILFFL